MFECYWRHASHVYAHPEIFLFIENSSLPSLVGYELELVTCLAVNVLIVIMIMISFTHTLASSTANDGRHSAQVCRDVSLWPHDKLVSHHNGDLHEDDHDI